nr:MAG TPA: hypothetical protein [Caudoviricetes sp.]
MMREYDLVINGRIHRMQLSEEDAARYGAVEPGQPEPQETKQAETPANKALRPNDK